jgi:hypothetical protein
MNKTIRWKLLNRLFVSVMVTGLALLTGCGGGSDPATSPVTYDDFGASQLVTITGYTEDIAEPFFSRDEQYLFFNDNSIGGKSLHYATYSALNDEFTYIGEVGPGINGLNSVQGVPTMDDNNIFYFVDTKFYAPLVDPPVFDTLFTGTWTGASVVDVSPVVGIAFPSPGFLNFDLEISPDGNTLYFVDGFFSGGPVPDAADIKVATFNPGSGLFERDANADAIMANITTSDPEYAPAISRNGLELFFTRLDPTSLDARIYRTTRANTADIFNPPQLVSAIPGFAEGATFSQDEKTIYYHWQNTSTGKFELYRVVRP